MTAESHNANLLERHDPTPQVRKKVSQSIDIPAANWATFLDGFTHQHQGWLVTTAIASGRGQSTQTEASRLKEVALVQVGKRPHIRISVGGPGPGTIHEVIDPVRLTFKLDAKGAHEGLDISTPDGSVVVLRFRVAASPEALDGVLPEAAALNIG